MSRFTQDTGDGERSADDGINPYAAPTAALSDEPELWDGRCARCGAPCGDGALARVCEDCTAAVLDADLARPQLEGSYLLGFIGALTLGLFSPIALLADMQENTRRGLRHGMLCWVVISGLIFLSRTYLSDIASYGS